MSSTPFSPIKIERNQAEMKCFLTKNRVACQLLIAARTSEETSHGDMALADLGATSK
jgi:hypothetical protein